jgi:hypothetical protein
MLFNTLMKIPLMVIFGLGLRRKDISGAFLAGYFDGLLKYEKKYLANEQVESIERENPKGHS